MSKAIPFPKILLIENDPAAANEVRAALAAAGRCSFEVEWVRQLSDGLARLGKGGRDAVVLELTLPDSQDMATFDKLFAASPEVPILWRFKNSKGWGYRLRWMTLASAIPALAIFGSFQLMS
jgi:DNA-binding response OmpR family regulator